MIKATYDKERANLLQEAQTLIDAGDIEKFEAKHKEVEALDDKFRAAELARENLKALAGSGQGKDPKSASVHVPDGKVVETMGVVTVTTESDDPYDTLEYRKAFMNFVCKGVPIDPSSLGFQNSEVTTTTDTSAVIPTRILNEIVRELESYGNIWAKVRKLNIQGGVSVPIMEIKPVATWIGETEVSADQKLAADQSVIFNYYGLECRLSQTLLVSVTTLEMFQRQFVPLAVEAIVKALEIAIIRGTGVNQMLGFSVDPRVPEENVIEVTRGDISTWAGWKQKVLSKRKRSYRKGDLILAQSTFDVYIDGLTDAGGQPIARVNYGITGGETYRFAGVNVETVEDDIIPGFDAAEAGEVIGAFIQLSDYAVNSNLEMRTERWYDQDANKYKNKCILICDGKLLDPHGVLILKKALEV